MSYWLKDAKHVALTKSKEEESTHKLIKLYKSSIETREKTYMEAVAGARASILNIIFI